MAVAVSADGRRFTLFQRFGILHSLCVYLPKECFSVEMQFVNEYVK